MLRMLTEYLEDYNQITTTQMHLVLFIDAVKHLCRICRVIRQPLGNGLLLGVGGSGRQSLTRLAAHMSVSTLLAVFTAHRVKPAFRDDADTDNDILADILTRIVARMSACRSACHRNNFGKLRVSDVRM